MAKMYCSFFKRLEDNFGPQKSWKFSSIFGKTVHGLSIMFDFAERCGMTMAF